jgi:hypothetical protein
MNQDIFSPEEQDNILKLKDYIYSSLAFKLFPNMFYEQLMLGNVVLAGPILNCKLRNIAHKTNIEISTVTIYALDFKNSLIWSRHLTNTAGASDPWIAFIMNNDLGGHMKPRSFRLNDPHKGVPGIEIDLTKYTPNQTNPNILNVVLTEATTKEELFSKYFTKRPSIYCTQFNLFITKDAHDAIIYQVI